MSRSQPVLKKSLEKERWDYAQKVHHDKLKAVKPSIDCYNTATYSHLQGKGKKRQMAQGFYCSSQMSNSTARFGFSLFEFRF
jgi:hypothetical protein